MANKKSNKNESLSEAQKKELTEMFVSLGEVNIHSDQIEIINYPFEPSIAYRQSNFMFNQIDEIDLKATPPTIRIQDELIFLTAEKKADLEKFANQNNIKIIERQGIWEWILEPFLDTEYTIEKDQNLSILLENYGIGAHYLKFLRTEVEEQMYKYNFETMLWEWVALGASDVLMAMRTKYNQEKFKDFYREVMNIALLERKSNA